MLNKLKSVDFTKLNPAQMKKVVAAMTQAQKKVQKGGKGRARALKAMAKAKAAIKGGQGELIDIED